MSETSQSSKPSNQTPGGATALVENRYVPPAGTEAPPSRRRGRTGIVAVLILSLLASAGTRYWADEKREVATPRQGEAAASTSLTSMNSFALGLLLGGLRGPLVMFLWTQSESQKAERNLEGLDTQIELIRLLQPEFDTVHIFQVWNKAYNISVQMASLANKYRVILDALDYAHNVDRAKPEDINIVTAIAQIYFDKLGGASEKQYYRSRVRTETTPAVEVSFPADAVDRVKDALKRLKLTTVVSTIHTDDAARRASLTTRLREAAAVRATLGDSVELNIRVVPAQKYRGSDMRPHEQDVMLDQDFNLLPRLAQALPGRERPANLPADAEWDNGSDFQYLPKYQPYPDGISPYAIAFNYYKRAEVLMNVGKQRHAQLSDLVVDSRPGLGLKVWAEEEWEQGRRREIQAFGLTAGEERAQLEEITANETPEQPMTDRHAGELAAFAYERAAQLAPDAIAEYARHISNNPSSEQTYISHMDELNGITEMCAADGCYLRAQLASTASDRDAFRAKAREHYLNARQRYQLVLVRYYTDPSFLREFVQKAGYDRFKTADRKGLDEMPREQLAQISTAIERAMGGASAERNEDRKEFDNYLSHIGARLAHLP